MAPDVLPGVDVDSSRLLYIGMTEDSLEARNHFGHKDSSFSSPRSLGALLQKRLGLLAIPRGSGRSAKDMTNYRFANGGEGELSAWMSVHLRVGFAAVKKGIREVELELIETLRLPVNLTGWKNPQRQLVKKLRKACRDEGRSDQRANHESYSSPRTGIRNSADSDGAPFSISAPSQQSFSEILCDFSED